MFNFYQNYFTRGFWGDEAWTSLISQLPYTQMLKTTAADFHPPGYYTVVELVYRLLGVQTEIVTRLISVFFFLLTIFVVYKLASEYKNKQFALYTALVVGLNPILFTYTFEARNYTMFAFAATTSAYFLLKLIRKFHLKTAVLFIMFSTLGIYTHYYMLFILAAQGLFLILFERKNFIKIFLLYVVVGLLFLPWIPMLFGQVTSVGQSYWIGTIDKKTHYEALSRILSGEQENIFRPFLFFISIALIGVGLWHHIVRKKFEKPYLLIWIWAIIPFILASLPGLKIYEDFRLPFRPIFFWRYLIGASVPLSMVIVHAAQRLNKKLYLGSIAALLVLSFAINLLTLARYPKTFKQVYSNEILPMINPQDKIVTVLPSFAEVLYYRNYFGLQNEVIVLPDGLVQFSGKSLLDSYVQNDVVKIAQRPKGRFFELTPGPKLEIVYGQQ